MYKVEYHPQVKKDVKRLDKPILKELKENQIRKILLAPHIGDSLKGDLQGMYSYHFTFRKIQYRIAYLIREIDDTIIILMIGKRENFYDLLKRRL